MIKLRDYQEVSKTSIFKYFEESPDPENPLVAMPTGTGKAVILAFFIKDACLSYPGTRILCVTHVKELIAQNYKQLYKVWPTAPVGIYSAGLGRWETGRAVTFAGIASAYKTPEAFGHVDLMVIDEAHLVSPKADTMYQKLIMRLRERNPQLKVIGFTATHYRMGQGLLTEEDGIFTDICFDMTNLESFNWFISQGYLSPLIPRKTYFEYDVSGVRTQNGEYVLKELQESVDQKEITKRILKEAIWLAKDRKHWLVFCSGIEHSIHTAEILNEMGIPATCVHSKMNDPERDKNIKDFIDGKYQAMCNNGILTTGFDYPEIDTIVMLRPTQSPGLWVQMLGRGTRPVYAEGYDVESLEGRLTAIKAGPKQNCLVLDFAGNTRRLGPINDPVIPKRKGAGGGGEPPVKVCEVCGVYNHAAVRFCTNCGAEFPKQVNISTGASTEELIAERTKALPKVHPFDVYSVTYKEHTAKESGIKSIKVTYFCGLQSFAEWVCLNHVGYARKRARDWWRTALVDKTASVPESTEEGLARIKELKAPKQIRVWTNKQDYPEVLSHVYSE